MDRGGQSAHYAAIFFRPGRSPERDDRLYDYKAAFQTAVDQVKSEGRYRVFADLKRVRGQFPKAVRRREERHVLTLVRCTRSEHAAAGLFATDA